MYSCSPCLFFLHFTFIFLLFFFFFFNDTATTEIYTLSLHDALPISADVLRRIESGTAPLVLHADMRGSGQIPHVRMEHQDRKSTRLNSSHANISYAVFCLKKKKKKKKRIQ